MSNLFDNVIKILLSRPDLLLPLFKMVLILLYRMGMVVQCTCVHYFCGILSSSYLLVSMFILLLSYYLFVLHLMSLLLFYRLRVSQSKFSSKLIIMVTLKKNVSSRFIYFLSGASLYTCQGSGSFFLLSFQVMLRFLFLFLIYTGKKKSTRSGILHQDMKKSGILFLCKFSVPIVILLPPFFFS